MVLGVTLEIANPELFAILLALVKLPPITVDADCSQPIPQLLF